MKHGLFVEDEKAIAASVCLDIEGEGFELLSAE